MRALFTLTFGLLLAFHVGWHAGRPATSSTAEARRSDTHAYRYEQVWRSAVRLVRVDYGFPVRDRDPEIGFVLFDYVDQGRSYPGSLELVRGTESRREIVRVTINIPAMPSYIERMVLDRLTRKLREEYGSPLPPPPEPEPVAEDDDEDEDEEDEDE